MNFLSTIIEDLYKQIAVLKDRIAYLKQENKVLKEENVHLRQENDRLKKRLGLNSINSSLPPSRNLYRVKKTRPRSGRKPGTQPGHKPPRLPIKPLICTRHTYYQLTNYIKQ